MKLEDLNPVDNGDYFLITCPECGEHEAFVYKADIQKAKQNPRHKIHWFCNRLNKCGAKGTLDGISEKEVKQINTRPNPNALTEQQQNDLRTLCSYFRNEPIPFSIRGISSEVLTRNDIVYFQPGFQKYMQLKSGQKLQKKYTSPVYKDRDILLPIMGDDGEAERILLRSKDKKLEKKEIQVKITDKATEIWNRKILRDPNVKTIFMCEGVYDVLSVLEAAKNRPEIGAIALSGCRKFKKAILEMQKIPACRNKHIVVCLDNDEAGDKEVEVLSQIKSFKFQRFNLKSHKDVNDFLQENPTDFKKTVLLAALKQ